MCVYEKRMYNIQGFNTSEVYSFIYSFIFSNHVTLVRVDVQKKYSNKYISKPFIFYPFWKTVMAVLKQMYWKTGIFSTLKL